MSAEETWDYRVRFYPDQQSQIPDRPHFRPRRIYDHRPDGKLAAFCFVITVSSPTCSPTTSGKTVVYAGGKVGAGQARTSHANPPKYGQPDAEAIVYSRPRNPTGPLSRCSFGAGPEVQPSTPHFSASDDLKSETTLRSPRSTPWNEPVRQ